MSGPLDYPPPEPGQSVALTWELPKVSALYYDRVWNRIRWPVVEARGEDRDLILPKEIGTNFISADDELRDLGMIGHMATIADNPGGFAPPDAGPVRKAMLVDAPDPESKARMQARLLVARLNQLHGANSDHGVVPVYSSLRGLDQEYKAGRYEVIAATLTGLRIVDEAQLTWEQVLEFRRDADNREKYRRFRHWLDAEMVGNSQAFIEDAIQIKLAAYESAMKKHGLQTVAGSFQDFLNSDALKLSGFAFLGSAAIPQLLELGSIVAGILAASDLTAKLATRLIDADEVKAGPNSEIAFAHEVKKLG